MAITFNGTNISAISFNGTAIGSVKFNGTEVFNSWTELRIGDDFIIGPCLAKVGYSVSSGVGFYMGSSVPETPAKLFDGDSSTYCLNTGNTSKVYYTMAFPFDFKLQSFTIIDPAIGSGFTSGDIRYSPERETGGAWGVTDQKGYYYQFSGRNGNGTTTYTNSALKDKVMRSLCLYTNSSKKGEAELKMTILVKTADYLKWKNQYASELANANATIV